MTSGSSPRLANKMNWCSEVVFAGPAQYPLYSFQSGSFASEDALRLSWTEAVVRTFALKSVAKILLWQKLANIVSQRALS